MILTREQVAEIAARAEKATPGPWSNTVDRFPKVNGGPVGGAEVATLLFATEQDATFIASARSDVPDLCATVQELRAALELAMDWTLDDWFAQNNKDELDAARRRIEEMLK